MKSEGAKTSTKDTASLTRSLLIAIIPSRSKISIFEFGEAYPPANKSPNLRSKDQAAYNEHNFVKTSRSSFLNSGSCIRWQKVWIMACY